MMAKFLYFLVICTTLNICSGQTASGKLLSLQKTRLKNKSYVYPDTRSGPQNYTVFDKNLVKEKIEGAPEIIKNYQAFFRETDEYRFDELVLGYVTPHNNHGYDVAKIFGNKFTHISPVWLQVTPKGKTYQIRGLHDVDKPWMVTVRNAGRQRKLKIVPKLLFKDWTGNDYLFLLFNEREETTTLVNVLVKTAKKYNFDGYVIDVWPQIARSIKFLDASVSLIKDIADGLARESLEMILVIPPKYHNEELFTNEHFDALYDYVTAFSLMVFFYSDAITQGANAPLPWIKDCITSLTSDMHRRKKILTTLNFFGNDYIELGGGGDTIVGPQYIDILRMYPSQEMKFDTETAEHYYQYTDVFLNKMPRIVYYPTLYSINKRLEMIMELKTGIAIWEIGQGLDYFYDLF